MGVAFAVTLGIIFGVRASADAMAVIIGVVLGVLAGVPSTFLITAALVRRQANTPPVAAPQPPVIVVNGSERGQPVQPAAPPLPALQTGSRQWTVIGDSDEEGQQLV